MRRFEDLEDQLLRYVQEEIRTRKAQLADAGLDSTISWRRPQLSGSDLELVVEFEKSGNLEDIVEFRVIVNDIAIVTLDDVKAWLPGVLDDVCMRTGGRKLSEISPSQSPSHGDALV